MRFLVYLLAGLAGGVLGGMGMGGGCVLIPILTVLCGVPQHMAQSVNLLTFLPMAAVSLHVHAENGLLDTRGVLWMIVPATLLSVLGGLECFGRRAARRVRRVPVPALSVPVCRGHKGAARGEGGFA